MYLSSRDSAVSSSPTDNEFTRSFDEVSGVYIAALRDGSGVDGEQFEKMAAQPSDDDTVIYRDEKTEEVCRLAENVARTPATVLLTGETGVGKEVFARFIHRKSKRAGGPMVAINCAALSESLLESELFGHEKGAFSGAIDRHTGVFEQADGGTLLLDEITEMPLNLQTKLLRVIQEREVVRVGGAESIPVDIRLIATTNRDLKEYVEEGNFRRDLYYRINVFPLEIPALRDRSDDIKPLASYYTNRLAAAFDSDVQGLTGAAVRKLEAYSFPGNIRELINIIERALILAMDEEMIDEEHIALDETEVVSSKTSDSENAQAEGLYEDTDVDEQPPHMVRFRAGDAPLTDIRRVVIKETLDRYDGNRSQTARSLGVSTRTIRNKLKQYKEDDES